MKAQVGIYHFGRHRSSWGIWCYEEVNKETGFTGSKFIKDCRTYEEVVRETYLLNGWGEPKTINRKY